MRLLPMLASVLLLAALSEAYVRRRGRQARRVGGLERKVQGRKVTKGEDCQYIMLSAILTSGLECANGDKFVLKPKNKTQTRKQFLIMDGEPLLAFVDKGKKFSNCTAFTDITSALSCKAIPGLAAMHLNDTSADSADATTAAGDATTAAAGDTTAAGTTAAGGDTTAAATTAAAGDTTAAATTAAAGDTTAAATTAAAGDTTAAATTAAATTAAATTAAGTTAAATTAAAATSAAAGDTTAGATTAAATTAAATTAAASTCAKCGMTRSERIVGGTEVTPINKYPWIAYLPNPGCGGTLVATEWVVTAAHCVNNLNGQVGQVAASEITVRLGEHDTATTDEAVLPTKDYAVSEIITHESYTEDGGLKNDIALLKLSEKAPLGTYTPACLPATGDTFTGDTGTVYGWGALAYNGEYPTKIQEVDQIIVSTAACQTSMDASALAGIQVVAGQMCAGAAGGAAGKDSCSGDSGGPFTVAKNGQHMLAGVVSFGNDCALKDEYGVYADTAVYRAWLDGKMAGAEFCTA